MLQLIKIGCSGCTVTYLSGAASWLSGCYYTSPSYAVVLPPPPTMNHITARPSPSSASYRFFQICAQFLRPTSRRYAASYQRTRTRLNVKPDASFLPSRTELHDHIIHNPPPSSPNVYHTPTIFLPLSDPRRQIVGTLRTAPRSGLAAITESSQMAQDELSPPVRQPYEKKYHLTAKDMDQMRELRKADPGKWSVNQLAKKFDCSSLFVSFVTEGLSKEKQEQQKQVTEVVKSRWGKKRRVAREDRAIRKERWYMDA